MKDVIDYLFDGLKKGYKENTILKTDIDDHQNSIIEYLLTVNVAQELINWNENEDWDYSIHLEYDSIKFFRNAFESSRLEGNDVFNMELIFPLVEEHQKVGRLDIAICKENNDYIDRYKSLYGIELKGINQSNDLIIADLKRLKHSIEMSDSKFINSIDSGYCLSIKSLGGNKRLSKKESLETAKTKAIETLKDKIENEVKFTGVNFKIHTQDFKFKSLENYSSDCEEYITTYEVGRDTGVVFGIVIELFRVAIE